MFSLIGSNLTIHIKYNLVPSLMLEIDSVHVVRDVLLKHCPKHCKDEQAVHYSFVNVYYLSCFQKNG